MIKITEYKAISSKGQKIIAALFLVTAHLSEQDPLRHELRTLAVKLATADHVVRKELCAVITGLVEAAVLARMIGESNARIIQVELKYFGDSTSTDDGTIASLFPLAQHSESYKGQSTIKKTTDIGMSFITKAPSLFVQEKKQINTKEKGNRHEKILSYINERKSANIKDISLLFPEVSEKTIQRELGSLVASGKITKRGNKRWSIYLAL